MQFCRTVPFSDRDGPVFLDCAGERGRDSDNAMPRRARLNRPGGLFHVVSRFARDERWLDRARRFAVHALAQAERIAVTNGRRRYSLFTGDVGTALFAAACVDADPRFPIIDVM